MYSLSYLKVDELESFTKAYNFFRFFHNKKCFDLMKSLRSNFIKAMLPNSKESSSLCREVETLLNIDPRNLKRLEYRVNPQIKKLEMKLGVYDIDIGNVYVKNQHIKNIKNCVFKKPNSKYKYWKDTYDEYGHAYPTKYKQNEYVYNDDEGEEFEPIESIPDVKVEKTKIDDGIYVKTYSFYKESVSYGYDYDNGLDFYNEIIFVRDKLSEENCLICEKILELKDIVKFSLEKISRISTLNTFSVWDSISPQEVDVLYCMVDIAIEDFEKQCNREKVKSIIDIERNERLNNKQNFLTRILVRNSILSGGFVRDVLFPFRSAIDGFSFSDRYKDYDTVNDYISDSFTGLE